MGVDFRISPLNLERILNEVKIIVLYILVVFFYCLYFSNLEATHQQNTPANCVMFSLSQWLLLISILKKKDIRKA